MKTFIFRNSRREKLAEALAGLTEGQAALRTILATEQAALQTDDWTVTDTTYRAVASDWVWHNFPAIKSLTDQDPVLVAFGTPSLLTAAQAAAISTISFPHPADPPFTYLDQVLLAVDNDQAIFTELLHAAHQVWLAGGKEQAAYPLDDVAVLLPLRIETIFDAPASNNNEDPASWKLSVRVIPDEASVCRDNAFVSKDEGKALIDFWESIKQPGAINETWLDGERAGIAWKLLSTKIRAERAAWLVAGIDVTIGADSVELDLPADMPVKPIPNRVGGMPPELKIYAVTTTAINGADHHLIGRLPKDENAQIDSAALLLELPSNAAKAKESWWASWEKAKEVGLGDEFVLPQGLTPQNIQALYVIGIGEETPEAHFTAQINAGELSIPRLGDATNTVHGADTGTPIDWQKVAKERLKRKFNPLPNSSDTGSKVQRHLTGLVDSLPFFPGADGPDDTLRSQSLAKALWPALWGHWLHDIWDMGDGAYRRGLWAFDNLCPEGPLMPLRIGDQPYGLLPVTSLELWEQPIAVDPVTAAQLREDTALAKSVNSLYRRWADAAVEKRSVVGKTSSEFMELLGQDAISYGYLLRGFLPFADQRALYRLDAIQMDTFRSLSLDLHKPAISIMGKEPAELYLAKGNGSYSRLPLVQSTQSLFRHQNGENRSPFALFELIRELINFPLNDTLENYDLELFFRRFRVFHGERSEFQFGSLPDSLLIRLLAYACQTSFVWRRNDPANTLLQQVLDVHQKQALNIAQEIDQEPWRQKETEPVTGRPLFRSVIPAELLKQWERAFCATLDTAANRIDPWVTGFAWQRLKIHSSSAQHNHRMGVYGWLDGPFAGQPGPTNSGLLHTPSYNQTLAALIMRDKFLSSARTALTNETGQSPWQMNITSEKVRLAEEIAEEVRMGFHFYEVIGRHVENIVRLPIKVRELRSNPKYAMNSGRMDPHEVCDGHTALPGLLKGDVDFLMDEDQQKALQLLQDSIDTYSDLLLGDGILQLINRQTDRAAETMEAAAGQSRPPAFELIRTPPSGYQLETVVLSTLPFVSVDSLAGSTHPIRLADPSVAAFIENKLGNDWTWTAVNEDDNTVLGSVTLAQIGLTALDTLAVSDELISELVRNRLGLPLVYISKGGNRQWEAFDPADNFLGRITIAQLNQDPDKLEEQAALDSTIRTLLGLPGDSVIKETVPADLLLWVVRNEKGTLLGLVDKLGLGLIPAAEEELNKKIRLFLGIPKLHIETARQHQLAQQLLSSLGSRPASGRDISDDKAAPVVMDTSIYAELALRYGALYQACEDLILQLRQPGASDGERAAALRAALAWGIAPVADPADRESYMAVLLGLELPGTGTALSILTENAAAALDKRLKDAVKPEDLATEVEIAKPLPNHKELKQQGKPDGVPSLAAAVANLAAPNARLVVLACWDKDGFVNNTKLVTAQADNIEEEWLTVIAAVRSNLARLEALQLEMEEPLLSWTNSPHDPWRIGDDNIVQQNLKARDSESVVKMQMRRFVTAYGVGATWTGEKVAVGLIDAFNEAIPMPQRKTMTAFGFDAPSARAPQAILLAVPPRPRQRLDADLLLKIVEETRMLAHARMARVEDQGDLQTLSSTMWLQSSGPTRVRLEPWPLFVNNFNF